MLFTIQDKCKRFVSGNTVSAALNKLEVQRENNFLTYFKENGTQDRVKFYPPESVIPYNGFSYFLLKLNNFFIKLSKGLFSFQIAVVAKPLPTLHLLLNDAKTHGQVEYEKSIDKRWYG